MIYSCFNEKSGLYEYFEDAAGHPTNGDLPVPKFGAPAGEIGVPAMEAGRPLPSGAKRTGKGLTARGILVRCEPLPVQSLSGLGAIETPTSLLVGVALLGIAALTLTAWEKKGVGPGDPLFLTGAAALAAASVVAIVRISRGAS